MIFYSVPITAEYLEQLSVTMLAHMVTMQNKAFENEFHILDEENELASCDENEQVAWLDKVEKSPNSAKPKKLLVNLIVSRASLLADIRKMERLDDYNETKKSELKSSDVEIQPCSSSKLTKLADDELI